MTRAAAVAAATATLLAFGGCGGEPKKKTTAADDPFTQVEREPSLTRTARRAAPRWERVAGLRGTAPSTLPLTIATRAIQWRARWRCTSGRLTLAVSPKPRSASARSGGRCPGSGEATWVQTGEQTLKVDARGGWNVVVEQQVDTPLHEAPLAAMRAPSARVIARGRFYPVERQGRGDVLLYRLGNGRTALRLQRFRTSSNTDLFLWLSTAPRPRTTKQTVNARQVGKLIALKSTIGEQNYLLPRSVDTSRIRSIAIWCAPIQIVYTAAALKR